MVYQSPTQTYFYQKDIIESNYGRNIDLILIAEKIMVW